jgi:hypothetical protein
VAWIKVQPVLSAVSGVSNLFLWVGHSNEGKVIPTPDRKGLTDIEAKVSTRAFLFQALDPELISQYRQDQFQFA